MCAGSTESCYPVRVFTGLVEAMGTLRRRSKTRTGAELTLEHAFGELTLGESISVNGVCLTVTAFDSASFRVEASEETLRVTSLANLQPGAKLNLERALRLGDRLGGHIVSGHVDGLAVVRALRPIGDSVRVTLAPPAELRMYLAPKGSATLDGVSLTINEVDHDGFEVMLIPHTREVTTLGALTVGSKVNLEVDALARYVCHYLSVGGTVSTGSAASTGGAASTEPSKPSRLEELLKPST